LSAVFVQIFNVLGDLSIDVPKAPSNVAQLSGKLVLGGFIPLPAVVDHLLDAGDGEEEEGEDPTLLASGHVLPTVSTVLSAIKVCPSHSLAPQLASRNETVGP
jgi:hypothetical protein